MIRKHVVKDTSKGDLYLLLGSNVGDRFLNLSSAIGLIGQNIGRIIKKSSIYETAPWGNADQDKFLNQVIKVFNTDFETIHILNLVLSIEQQMGRIRGIKYGPRIMDIDILFRGQEVIESPNLQVPHPEIANRKFALSPMAEIASDFVHPVQLKTIEELNRACKDTLEVYKIDMPNGNY